MANINLTTSYESDIFINVELKIIKSNDYKISKVDLINYILEEISKDEQLSEILRNKVSKKLNNLKLETELRLNKKGINK